MAIAWGNELFVQTSGAGEQVEGRLNLLCDVYVKCISNLTAGGLTLQYHNQLPVVHCM